MNVWFGNSEQMSGIGELSGNQIFNVPFGMTVGRIGVIEKGTDSVVMLGDRELIDSGFNVAGERRDVLAFSEEKKSLLGLTLCSNGSNASLYVSWLHAKGFGFGCSVCI